MIQQSGDVRGRDRRRAHHHPLHPRSRHGGGHLGFTFQINLWLWFTVLFANFAEAVAEGRGKAQAATLRRTAPRPLAKLLARAEGHETSSCAGARA